MRRYLILFLLISSTVIFSSCAVKTVAGYSPIAQIDKKEVRTDYFTDIKADYVYKAAIEVYGNNLGGIVIIKKTGADSHRVAFTTEFGNKLFDFTFTGNEFTVNYILEDLDRGIIKNTLRDDFRLLLKNSYSIESMYENPETIVYKSNDGKRFNYLFTDRNSGRLKKLVNATKTKEKVEISYDDITNTLAKSIIIAHKNIKLRIALNYINE
ncbi:hypothetical protein LRS05_04100 [Flavobacterium sp. J372]|uniref:hypothetical protein n=1 Tax=Flavobacterium sp. J372 TaxID=2898436 RepID=UPI002150E6C3|nr:hypothetical protein [Flavobacterium sp. J372]MCR5861380.1 hypothetical protein [Flavobacterium sp. J372]